MWRWKRLVALWAVVRGDARRLWYAWKHPQAPAWLKLGSVGLLLYLLWPVDLIPDVIPFLGWLDDLVIVPAVLHWMLKRLPPDIRQWADAQASAARAGPAP